jgi:hypothetical protein
MIKVVLLILLYIAFPLVIIYMCRRWSIFKKLGSIVLAYAFGLIFGSIGILPKGSDGYYLALQGQPSLNKTEVESLFSSGAISENDIYVNTIASTQDLMSSVFVLIAFPLLLFSLNVKRWLRFAKEGFISMILALISVVAIVILSLRMSFPTAGKLPECLLVFILAVHLTWYR